MKISTLTASLLATTLATSAFAVENIEVGASAKLWYQTNTTNKDGAADLFEQPTAVALMEADLAIKADLFDGLKGETNVVILDSLGLENDLVGNLSNATTGHQAGDEDILKTQWWVSTANLKYNTGNTDVQAGRMTLNTPLLFTEKWNAGYNTFEGGVVTNTDVSGVKLTAMYITGNNGTGVATINGTKNIGPGYGIKIPSTVMYNGNFYGFGTAVDATGQSGSLWTDTTVVDGKKSLYSVGAEINPIDDLNINLWYYNISSVKDAYWADASYKIAGVFMGVQNSGMSGKDTTTAYGATGDNMITAFKLGYTMDKLNFFGAYSFTDDKENAPVITNMSTNRKSKIYTQAIVQDGGIIGAADTKAWKVQASYKFESWKLVGFVQNVQQEQATNAFKDSTEYDLVASTKIGKHVNLKGIYMHREYDKQAAGDDAFDFVRLIASVNF